MIMRRAGEILRNGRWFGWKGLREDEVDSTDGVSGCCTGWHGKRLLHYDSFA